MTERLTLVRARDVAGLPVVTVDGGEDAAEIKDVVYDADDHRLIGFTLNKRGWFRGSMKSTLVAGDVVGIGADAVMVRDETALDGSGSSADGPSPSGAGHEVVGIDVVSSSGSVIGTVVDVVLETGASPNAVGYEVETETGSVFIPSTAQMGLSAQHLIVPAEAEEFTRDDLAGFGAAIRSFRDRLGGRR
ncbi:PRC-barrel domain-containing protein [Ilumatobacter sp.]|uniref:PRC-barrel domain-containing protein n=1 Tax=Ilumatobacter sp. TaxID=1967498 RepID=UPI003B51B500